MLGDERDRDCAAFAQQMCVFVHAQKTHNFTTCSGIARIALTLRHG